MNIIRRLIARSRFRKYIRKDESINVVEGMVKARQLYKELCMEAHPDRHPSNRDVALDLMQRINENRHNYAALAALKSEVEEKLM